MADPYYLPSLADGTKYATSPIRRAAVDSGLNSVGLGSLLGPLGTIYGLHSFLKDYIVGGNEAERAKREAEFRAATEQLQGAGFDPYQTYSQDAVQAALDAAPEFAGLPGMDAGALSRDLIGDTINRYMQDPSAYSTVTGANQFAPTDYVKDVLALPGQIFEDPSSIFSTVLNTGILGGSPSITGTATWGGGKPKESPGTSQAVYTGKVGDKVYTGASTGVPAVDAIIRRVLGQSQGDENTTMGTIEAAVEAATGYPVGAVANILKDVFKDASASTPSPTSTPTGGGGGQTDQTGTGDSDDKNSVVITGKGTGSETKTETGGQTGCPEGSVADEDGNCVSVVTPPPEPPEPPTPCPEGFERNAAGNCVPVVTPPPPPPQDCSDPVYAAQHPEECLSTPPPPKPCQDGFERDAAGNCVPVVTPPPPPPPKPCQDGFERDAAGNCVPVVTPPPPKPCEAGYERDAAGNCVPIVTPPPQNCNNPAYAAENPAKCGLTVENCSDPVYAMNNPEKCKTTQPPPPPENGGGGGFNLDALLSMQPQYRTVTATPGELAEIDYLYDVGGESIFAPNIEPESEEDKNLARIRSLGGVPYAQGGQVDVVELALQLLRG